MSKIYILNTTMTSSVYIEMMKLIRLPSSSYYENCCTLVTPKNLGSIFVLNKVDNFFICGREIQKESVISHIKNRFNIDSKNIIVIEIPHYKDFDFITEKYGIKKGTIKTLQINDVQYYSDEYYMDLCYEFFYTFVKPLYPELTKPDIKILEEMNGFLHIKNSIYKTISDELFKYKFYQKPQIFDNNLEKLFTIGFGGSIIFEHCMSRQYRTKFNLHANKIIDLNMSNRYINFLERSKFAFGLFYDDKNNTCYVIKKVCKNLKENFSYKIDNRQYSYLNCINVPNWLYNTPPEKLDIKRILSIKNVDVRTLAIKKIGMEKLMLYGRVIDSWKNYPENEWWKKSEYKLIDMHDFVPPRKKVSFRTNKTLKLNNVKYAPFLCMKNQTTSVYHLEGVSPECKTLYDAIKMRYNELNIKDYDIKDIK